MLKKKSDKYEFDKLEICDNHYEIDKKDSDKLRIKMRKKVKFKYKNEEGERIAQIRKRLIT